MELIGEFKSEKLNALLSSLLDAPEFMRQSTALGYDPAGNIVSCGMQIFNRRNGVTVELFEQIGQPPLVNLALDVNGQRMMLASNRALVDVDLFWEFYGGVPVVQDSKGSGPGYVRRMN